MKLLLAFVFSIASLILAGCVSTPPPAQNSNLTVGQVKRLLVKNKTTQAEVNAKFGAPNLVTRNADNKEVWSYNRMSSNSQSSSSFATLLLIGRSSASSGISTQSFDLIVTFNSNDIVQDYNVISSTY